MKKVIDKTAISFNNCSNISNNDISLINERRSEDIEFLYEKIASLENKIANDLTTLVEKAVRLEVAAWIKENDLNNSFLSSKSVPEQSKLLILDQDQIKSDLKSSFDKILLTVAKEHPRINSLRLI